MSFESPCENGTILFEKSQRIKAALGEGTKRRSPFLHVLFLMLEIPQKYSSPHASELGEVANAPRNIIKRILRFISSLFIVFLMAIIPFSNLSSRSVLDG